MAKPLKIEALKLQGVVAAGLSEGKNPQQIAEDCTRAAKQPISNMAVRRYLEAAGVAAADHTPVAVATAGISPASAKVSTAQKKAIIKSEPNRVTRLVDRDIDLIELQFATTRALADRFEWIAALPDTFERRMKQLHDLLKQEGTETATLDHWGLGFTIELRRNIGNMAALNREIRQNSQFMAQLREKAFEFNLIQEYLSLFMEVFREASPEAYEIAEQKIASNPRMQRIVEQQKELRGYQEA